MWSTVESSSGKPIALERVAASSRSVGGVHYVCPVGWCTDVYRLEGAAGALWAVLAEHDSLSAAADALEVASDDAFLLEAIRMLCQFGLIRGRQ